MKRLIVLICVAAFSSGCGDAPYVVAEKKRHAAFVGTKPQVADVVGTYVLRDQSVFPGGASALAGHRCILTVQLDGTFSVTNYPVSDGTKFGSFHSVTGTWELDSIGTSYGYGTEPKEMWGLRFREPVRQIGEAALTGPTPPYGLLKTIGDPDCDWRLRFERESAPNKFQEDTVASAPDPQK